jgi:hypothetical protein
MVLKHHLHFTAAVVAAAWLFDFLFWKQQPGITIPIYILVLLLIGLTLAIEEGYRPSWKNLLLIVPLLFFAIVIAIRLEPFTQVMAWLLVLFLLAALALSLRSGIWLRYRLLDWIVGGFRLLWGGLSGGASLQNQKPAASAEGNVDKEKAYSPQFLRPVAFGVFLALPVVLFFGWILSLADPVFARLLNEWIAIERWPEYIWRGVYIIGLAYLLAGIYLFSLFKSHEEKLITFSWLSSRRGLGGIESITVLACVNLLFALFVGVQFHYFFGGQTNINLEGFTYSEYARRGFFELLLVSVLSLLLFLGLGAIANRSSQRLRVVFSSLGILLVALVGVILYSAFLRLQLYEMAYGFSRLRTYTHIFMVWLGILLFISVVLEAIRKPYMFALSLILVSIGFGATLAVINVDGFIARQNVLRARQGYELDVQYLTQLSDDAVPALVQLYGQEQDEMIRERVGAVLACHYFQSREVNNWRSYHLSQAGAKTALESINLSGYTHSRGYVRVNSNPERSYGCSY